jgi:hypothetical protein
MALRARAGSVRTARPIIDGERHCCRFLQIVIAAEQDLGFVTLDITGPHGTAEFLESWITPDRESDGAT